MESDDLKHNRWTNFPCVSYTSRESLSLLALTLYILKEMSLDRLELLRERNKQLLDQLRRHGAELERLCGRSESRKREREDGPEERTPPEERRTPAERTPPEETVTMTGGDRGPARAALARPCVRFAGNEAVCLTAREKYKLKAKLASKLLPFIMFWPNPDPT